MQINIVVTDVVNDVTYSRRVNTRVVITLLLHDVIHWKTVTSYDKQALDSEIYALHILINSIILFCICKQQRHKTASHIYICI